MCENNVCCPQGGTLIAVGLGVAAAGFAGKHLNARLWVIISNNIRIELIKSTFCFPLIFLQCFWCARPLRLPAVEAPWPDVLGNGPQDANICEFTFHSPLINLHKAGFAHLPGVPLRHSRRTTKEASSKRCPSGRPASSSASGKPPHMDFNGGELIWSIFICDCSPVSTKAKVREAHRRIMVLNHPDKGQPHFV